MLKGKIISISLPFFEKKAMMVLQVEDVDQAKKVHEKVQENDVYVDFKLESELKKRSLSQNAYAWKLMNEIAKLTNQSVDLVYMTALKRYGQSFMVRVVNGVPEETLDRHFKYWEKAGACEDSNFIRVYLGSSTFNVSEMKHFIDGIISEAKDLGIQTETPEEVAKWKVS